ncbi:MAG: hypothetical protein M1383_00880 [Patescibacteria group bacterium]|nr:hypothetical protein [Patescibacteria group bacterium]
MGHALLARFLPGTAGGFTFAALWELITCRWFSLKRFSKIRRYHFHHSLFGPAAWLACLRFYNMEANFLLSGFGLGVVLQHAWNEGFVYVSKN